MSGCAVTTAGDGAVDGTRSALIIASDQYADPGLRRLRAPAADARALAAVLREPEIGGFEVRTLLNEPAHEVNLAVEEFFADRRADDLLLMHFSCHGVKDEDGELYFAMTSTRLRRLAATAVAAEFVNRRMGRSRSRRVVLLLDCCYAGAFERGMTARAGPEMGIEQQFGGRGRAVITASSAMEYAFEGDELADTRELAPSVFTSALVEGLETGEADRDQDGLIALDELYDYVYDKVRAATPNQTPGKWTFGVQGELVIARRRRPVTTPAPLPHAVQAAIESPLAAVRAGAVQELTRLLHGRHAGLALAARLVLERLTEDDSRTVAAAATAALSAQTKPPAPPEPPEPAPPELALSVHDDPTPLPGPGAAAAALPEAVPEIPVGARPGAQDDAARAEVSPAPAATMPATAPVPAPSPAAGMIAAWSALRPLGIDGTTPQARAYRRLLVAGGLAIAGAVLMVVGLFPSYQSGYSLAEVLGEPSSALRWPITITAALCLVAGACIFRPRAGPLIGPGLLLGGVAASTSILVFYAGGLAAVHEVYSGGFWLQLAAMLILVAAACLAGLALRRAAEVRLVRWPPQSALAWVVALLGVAGALALVFQDKNVAAPGGQFGSTGEFLASSIWLTIMALVVPACAAVAVPRQLGVALLAGWIGGGGALYLFSYYLLDYQRYDAAQQNAGPLGGSASLISLGPVIVFGLTLLALLVVAVPFARAAASARPDS
jgi:Caspase domain